MSTGNDPAAGGPRHARRTGRGPRDRRTRVTAAVLCGALLTALLVVWQLGYFDRDVPRIVSLSPSATETLYALGAGEQVVAVDEYSDYPKAARAKRDPELSGQGTRVGEVLQHDPDLVIVPDYDGVEGDRGIVDDLREKGVDVVVDQAPRDLRGVYETIELLGRRTDRSQRAHDLVRSMSDGFADVVRHAPDTAGMTYYHEVDRNHVSITSRTFAGAVYKLFGLVDMADGKDVEATRYPQLTDRQILAADPDLVFLADARWGETPDTVRARDGWERLTAVREKHVFALDDDLCSRWGPRLVDFARAISATLGKGL